MIRIMRQSYPSPLQVNSESKEVKDEELLAHPNEALRHVSTLETTQITHLSIAYSWDEMKDDHQSGVRDWFCKRITNTPLDECMLCFRT